MSFLATILLASAMLGQQAPLVRETELPPPTAAPARAPSQHQQTEQAGEPAAQREQPRQAAPPQHAAPAPPDTTAPTRDQATLDGTRGSGGKRVVAFWVMLPGKK